MPIVFIHGVATRSGPDFDKGKEQRETFFSGNSGPHNAEKYERLNPTANVGRLGPRIS